MSRLLYLLPMWGGLPLREMKKLQTLMNRCARTVLNKNRRTRTRVLMEGCGWLYLSELIKFHSSVQMFKIVFMNKPESLRRKLIIDNENRVTTTPGRLKIARDSFRLRATQTWNELPDVVIAADKLSKFKKLLRKHLTDLRPAVTPRRQIEMD